MSHIKPMCRKTGFSWDVLCKKWHFSLDPPWDTEVVTHWAALALALTQMFLFLRNKFDFYLIFLPVFSLFPRMPRHNYHLVAPQVRALCEKHGVPYQVKTLWRGMTDVVRWASEHDAAQPELTLFWQTKL